MPGVSFRILLYVVIPNEVRNPSAVFLILSDDIPAHPYAVAVEAAMLAPKSEVSMFPWKESKDRSPPDRAPNPFLPPRPQSRLRLPGEPHRKAPGVDSAATHLRTVGIVVANTRVVGPPRSPLSTSRRRWLQESFISRIKRSEERPYLRILRHDSPVRWTSRHLRRLGNRLVIPLSPVPATLAGNLHLTASFRAQGGDVSRRSSLPANLCDARKLCHYLHGHAR